jgi:YfiH family protein
MKKLFIQPEIFSRHHNICALQTTRHGGVSPKPFASLNLGHSTPDNPANVLRNKEILCGHLGIDPSSLVTADQVHGTTICEAAEGGHRREGFDAFITDTANVFLCILTADCYPILLYDPEHNAAGAVHAGWKGTAANAAGKTVEAMKERFGSSPSSCLAYIGAGISGNAYEVGREVADRFSGKHLTALPDGRTLLDLASANLDQLLEAGIPDSHIEVSPFCTVRNNRDFFSYRREKGQTGRMIALIGIKPGPSP